MKDLRPRKGKFLIARLVAEGEHATQDFKYQISDALKIARSVSAFANREGGRLLIGVKDNGVIAGVRSEEDIYMIEQAASLYCRPAVEVTFEAYRATDEGHVVIVAEIASAADRPVKAREPDGRWRAYYRVADENIVASPLMVRAWQRSRRGGDLLNLDDCSRCLLRLIEEEGSVDTARLMRAARVSRATAEDCIVTLASMGAVRFVYRSPDWVIAR